jgi:hypothetical protein
MTTLAETLQQARLCHHAGDLRQAERLYQQVVQADGQRPDVWLLLGQACQGLGDTWSSSPRQPPVTASPSAWTPPPPRPTSAWPPPWPTRANASGPRPTSASPSRSSPATARPKSARL